MEDVLRRLLARDRFAAAAGIELLEVREGHARARMAVREQHLNGVDIVQGGAVFTLADLAFAAAANSHGTVAVAVQVSISFLRPTRAGVLTAEATEVSRSARISTCTVRVTDDDGALVALFHGTAFRRDEPVERFAGGG
jgi:acyl-CoA thioesterase